MAALMASMRRRTSSALVSANLDVDLTAECPLGCLKCELKPGDNSPTCTTCITGLDLTNKIPATCEAAYPCGRGTYYDNAARKCTA